LIQGKVKIISDDRTNMLIIIARPTNFPFFERLIKELDRKVEPEVVVRVIQLQWSDSDQMLRNGLYVTSGTAGGRKSVPVDRVADRLDARRIAANAVTEVRKILVIVGVP